MSGAWIETSCQLLAGALGRMDLPSTRPFTMVDFGCGQGRNSLGAARFVLSVVRGRIPDLPVVLVLEDRGNNDFGWVLGNAWPDEQGQCTECLDGPSWIFLSGASFYDRVVPNGWLDLGLSFSSLHYLSRQPEVERARGMMHSALEPGDCEKFRAQAEADWETFLMRRAEELPPGGRLLLALGGRDEHGASGQEFYGVMSDVLREMAREGAVDGERADRFVLPFYYRSREELRGPIDDAGHRLHGLFEVEALVENVDIFFESLWRGGDGAAYAEACVPFIRQLTESRLAGALFDNPASLEAAQTVDAFYGRLQRRIAEAPEACPVRSVMLQVLVARR